MGGPTILIGIEHPGIQMVDDRRDPNLVGFAIQRSGVKIVRFLELEHDSLHFSLRLGRP